MLETQILLRNRNPGKIDDRLSNPIVELTYSSNGDANGLFYYIGTQGYTQPFINPGTNDIVVYSQSSVFQNNEGLKAKNTLSNREATSTPFHTNGNYNEWVQVDLQKKFRLKTYSIQGRTDFHNNHLTAWKILASNDGITWAQLDQTNYSMSQSVWYTKSIDNINYYRYYRLQSTGADTSGSGFLVFAEWEFYGTLSLTN